MDWGIPTLLEAADPQNAAQLCRSLGFRFVELNMNLPEYQSLDIPLLQSVADQYQIYYTIHLDENLDVCNFNPRVAEAYLETMLDTIQAAKQLKIPVLNMHLQTGVYFTLPEGQAYLYHMYKKHFLSRIKETIVHCEEAAGDELTICVENTGIFSLSFLQEALVLFLRSPLFNLTFDIGHDHSAGGVDMPHILAHEERLCHFHIHDAAGKKNHLSLGSGELDLPWYIGLAEKNHCRAVLEVKTVQALIESSGWLRERSFLTE